MAYFDRFDICEAYCLLEWDWHSGGWLQERPSNVRRGQARGYIGEATSIQLARMEFRPAPGLKWTSLTENGRDIYMDAARSFGLPIDHLSADCSLYEKGEELCDSWPTCPDCSVKYEELVEG